MIYCLNPEMYPTPDQIIEEISYQDENDFEWKIARITNGFFVKYFGKHYFKETYFSCDLKSGEHILINNTNCIFIQDIEFETFVEVRNVLKIGYTDEIWEVFKEMFEERFEHGREMLDSEMVDSKEKDPHEVSNVKCDLCNKEWVAVRPEGLQNLECPNCGNMVNFENV